MAESFKDFVRSLFKSGSITFVGQVAELGISFIAALIIARYLGPEGFGGISIGVTVVSTATPIILLGLKTGVGRELPRYDDTRSRRSVVAAAFQLSLPLSIIVGIGVFFFSGVIASKIFNDPSVAPILRIFAVAIPFVAFRELSLGVIQGLQLTFPKVIARNIAFPLSRLLLSIPAIILGLSTLAFAVVYTIPFVFTAILAGWFVYRRLSSLEGGFDSSHSEDYTESGIPSGMRRNLLLFSIPLMVTGVMQRVLRDLDTFLLGYFPNTTTSSIGVYNVLYPLAMLPQFVLSSFSYLFIPVISELHAERRYEEMTRLYQISTKWVFFGTLPILLPIVVFSNAAISYTFGPEYVTGATALSILAVGYSVSAFVGPNSEVLTSIGRTKTIMLSNAGAAILNAGANVLLIPIYGIEGAALATGLSYLAMNIIFSTQLYRATGIHPFRKSMLKPAVYAIALVMGIYWLVYNVIDPSLLGIVVIYAAFITLYLVGLLVFGAIEEEEVMLVLDFEDKFGVDLGPVKLIAGRLIGGFPKE